MIKKIILLLFFSSFLLQARAQEIAEKPVSGQSSAKVVELYRGELSGQSPLYQGRAYTGFDNRITGHAFFYPGSGRRPVSSMMGYCMKILTCSLIL